MKRRAVHGVLLLDKPSGESSNRSLQRVKRFFNAEKAGHTGSLDPLASGMLPICLGEATKFAQYLLDADKTYSVLATLGASTTTADREGEINAECAIPDVTEADLLACLENFKGPISQIPPMYSALKHQGQPLYKLARQGQEIERPARQVHIHALDLLDFTANSFSLKVKCSKGTYIRTLVEDIAKALGTLGHVAELRRHQVAGFAESDMHTFAALEDKAPALLDPYLLPIEVMLQGWAWLHLDPSTSQHIYQGQRVLLQGDDAPGDYALRSADGHFLGLGEILADGRLKAKRLLAHNREITKIA